MACHTPPQRYAITHAQFKEQFLLSSYTENGDIMVMSPMFHHKPPYTHMLAGTAVFASCRSQSCPIELLPVQAGDEIVIDARIIFINSGPCMIPQNTTFLQLFKGDVLEENLRYECHDVEVCPPRMGSFQAVPAVLVGGGSHKFNINLTKASAMMDDEGIYRVRVRVFNPRNGFAFMTKALSVSIYGMQVVQRVEHAFIFTPSNVSNFK